MRVVYVDEDVENGVTKIKIGKVRNTKEEYCNVVEYFPCPCLVSLCVALIHHLVPYPPFHYSIVLLLKMGKSS